MGYNNKDKKREPKRMTVMQLIWKLLKLRFKHGNVNVKTWVQYEGFCDLYEPEYENHVYGEEPFISVY